MIATLLLGLMLQAAPTQPRPEDTEQWSPEPRIVTPGPAVAAPPPSDAVILFDGTDLGEWVSVKDGSPAQWTVADGAFTVRKGTGNIETKRRFTDYQLHLEWRIPPGIQGSGQGRGNSGLFLASTGKGDAGYELQILDSFDNKTYVNGQAGSLYKQSPSLADQAAGPWRSQLADQHPQHLDPRARPLTDRQSLPALFQLAPLR